MTKPVTLVETNRSNISGASPGLIDTEGIKHEVLVTEIKYNGPKSYSETKVDPLKIQVKTEPGVNRLLIIQQYRNEDFLRKIKEDFKIHSLTIEDLIHTDQRSKYESYENYDFFIVNKFWKKADDSIAQKQISLILTEDVVMVFIDELANIHDVDAHIWFILERIENGKGRVRERDLGYLAYTILDSIVDSYFELIEEFEREIAIIDSKMENEEREKLISKRVFSLKRDIIEFKKSTWPLRDMISSIIRNENSFLFKNKDSRNILFIRDLQDHIHRITETADSLRDTAYSLVDLHMNMVSLKMNEVMKILTLITTIFVPITFLTSVYGMNFDSIPELHIPHAYPIFWCFILVLSVALLKYFRKKNWL